MSEWEERRQNYWKSVQFQFILCKSCQSFNPVNIVKAWYTLHKFSWRVKNGIAFWQIMSHCLSFISTLLYNLFLLFYFLGMCLLIIQRKVWTRQVYNLFQDLCNGIVVSIEFFPLRLYIEGSCSVDRINCSLVIPNKKGIIITWSIFARWCF